MRLRKLSGLDLKTIALARARLVGAPLASCYERPHRSCAAIPALLLTNADMSAGARLLYGQLQGVPNFEHQGGSFTYAALSHLTGSSDDALRRTVAELVATGWLAITQANRKRPLSFTLRNPVATQLSARISAIRRRVRGAQHRGEALMREFLNARVALDDHEDNASPDLLLNPYTGELMELDRYYPNARVAFEHNGAQPEADPLGRRGPSAMGRTEPTHGERDEGTDLATFEETVKQVGRDAMKAFICKARGIELAIIHPEDLSLKAMEEKIPGRLPRRALEGMEPVVAALEGLASEYRERTAEERARKGHRHRPDEVHAGPGA